VHKNGFVLLVVFCVMMLTKVAFTFLIAGIQAQHYCWPCAEPHGVIGKWTTSASNAPSVYDWYLRYLNNVEVGSNNEGDGSHSFYKEEWETEVLDSSESCVHRLLNKYSCFPLR
jgi:hypothetical protein